MNRSITFLFFVAAVVAVGVYFFRMVHPFLFPLLMAGTLALLVQPVFARTVQLMKGRRKPAAIVVSAGVIVVVVLPIFLVLGFATQELVRYGSEVVREAEGEDVAMLDVIFSRLKSELSDQEYKQLCESILNGNEIENGDFPGASPKIVELLRRIREFNQDDVQNHVRRESGAAYVDISSLPVVGRVAKWLAPYVSQSDLEDLRESGLSMARALLADVYERTAGLITNIIGFVVGFVIMMLAFYYFLAEGPTIAQELESVLPFEAEDEVAVVKQFETICRGVVLGTLMAAFVQAMLLGGALAFLEIPAVWLLTCLTFVLSMVPLVGAGGVYVPVTGYLLWNERYGSAIFLLLYGMLIVSTADNIIRAYTIHGTSRLHPLVALVSALGALKLVGLWGIFVGPVVAGIFYALLKILQQKLSRMERHRVVGGPRMSQ